MNKPFIKKRSIWAASILSLRLLISIVLQKVIAIKLGPAGTALFSHFQNLISLFTQPIQDVIGQGFLSAFHKKESLSKGKLIGNSILFSCFATLAIALFLFVFEDTVSYNFNFTLFEWGMILLALILLGIQLLLTNYLIARAALSILSTLVFLQGASIILLLYFLDLNQSQTLYYYILIQAAYSIIFFIIISFKFQFIKEISFKTDKKINKHFIQFLTMGITIWICSKATDFWVRDFAIKQYGSFETGFWQAAVKISDAYKGLFISFLMITFYPMINSFHKPKALQNFIKNQAQKTALIILIGFPIIFYLSEEIIALLFSEFYDSSSYYFKLIILADIFVVLSYPFALVLMAKTETKSFMFCEFSSTLIFLSYIIVSQGEGLEHIIYASIVRFLIYLLLTIFNTKKYWTVA